MTPQEAIQRIKQHNKIHSKNERFAIYITEALNMAVEVLEKQIPKKIDGKDEDDLVCGCHICGEVNALWKMNGNRNNYCGNCGQALDWGDTE